jgi:hypothetical protein
MGLDIYAASHLVYARPIPKGKALDRLEAELDERGKSLDEVYYCLWPNDRAHRARLRGMKPGLYEFTPQTRRCAFRAGPYSYYNWWRNELSLFALGAEAQDVWMAPEDYRGRPFVELIDFTDCDGRVGTPVAAKLAADFTAAARRATRHAAAVVVDDNPDAGADWLRVYRDFARAFRVAARAGALKFC